MAHTPGPWTLQSWDSGRSQRIFANYYYVGIAGNSDFTAEKNMDNARLMAAAPDLLEALTELYNHTKNDMQIAGLNISAKNAIDKAVGKE
jgi:hypothetical protein